MFFVLSKVLFFLLVPFWWVVILLTWMLLSKNAKTKKKLLVTSIVILVLFTNPFLYRQLVILWQPAAVQLPSNKTFEAGIILGGMSGHDKNNQGYFGNNADRFIQTVKLYHQGIIKKIIVSGGTGSLNRKELPEAFFLRGELIASGVKDADIIIEPRSRNTFENAVYSKKIADSLHLQPPFILVTSALHMKRSISVFKKANFDCIAFPCDYKVTLSNFSFFDLIPAISLLDEWSLFIKEVVGLYVYKLTGKA